MSQALCLFSAGFARPGDTKTGEKMAPPLAALVRSRAGAGGQRNKAVGSLNFKMKPIHLLPRRARRVLTRLLWATLGFVAEGRWSWGAACKGPGRDESSQAGGANNERRPCTNSTTANLRLAT